VVNSEINKSSFELELLSTLSLFFSSLLLDSELNEVAGDIELLLFE